MSGMFPRLPCLEQWEFIVFNHKRVFITYQLVKVLSSQTLLRRTGFFSRLAWPSLLPVMDWQDTHSFENILWKIPGDLHITLKDMTRLTIRFLSSLIDLFYEHVYCSLYIILECPSHGRSTARFGDLYCSVND